MPSLVPGFIIDPVLRQARRLSSNFTTTTASGPGTPLDTSTVLGSAAIDDNDEAPEPASKAQTSENTTDATAIEDRTSSQSTVPPKTPPHTGTPTAFMHTLSPPAQQDQDQHKEESPTPGPNLAILPMPTPPSQGQGHRDGHNPTAVPLELAAMADSAQVPATLPAGFFGNVELPEDDGMQALRQRILAVQSRDDIHLNDKAHMMHSLLIEDYKRLKKTMLPIRPATPASPAGTTTTTTATEATCSPGTASSATAATIAAATATHLAHDEHHTSGPLESLKLWHASLMASASPLQTFTLSEDDLRPTYVPGEFDSEDGSEPRRLLGCEHYRRNVKMQCSTCEAWYTCRLCHNDVEDHALPRRDTKNMLCMLCGHAQRVGDVCAKCGESAARYYCNICKLWNDDPDTSIYHCVDCGICRVGEGLGKDFVHCKNCGSCIAINQEESHRCREGVMDCDCPICGEYIFTSHKKVVTMKCGHMIHDDCRAEYIKQSYKCPICNKSVENMESMFRRLDKHLQEQPMPDEYRNTRAIILCNDCEAKTSTDYHWGGLRCEVCLSYNTVELMLINPPNTRHGQQQEDDDKGKEGGAANTTTTTEATNIASTAAGTTHHDTLHPPGTPLSSSPRSDTEGGGVSLLAHPHSPAPTMSFRSASPSFMTSPTRAPVLATAPPGYSEQGFEIEGDEDDYRQSPDMEDADILGLFDRRKLAWGRRKFSDS
ncbi:ring finger and chy zinc finger domain-containing protein [Ophiostoma piceae UAMH 11346]|uniref:Ring finger and chy zinc finger domain-containing protein n=1 Tax=Ophiostoma piceae (strain UAMH 11346) TaxID=1262450 RepID=S3CA25_OPHP1|nr:ring finger and chy zinc finger domain-containing protein [Ophiostoma piceae UAMH 11346]